MKFYKSLTNLSFLIGLLAVNMLGAKKQPAPYTQSKIPVARSSKLIKREVRAALTTSLIIPCCASHARHLYKLLELYEQQTCLPDEVVISLSEANNVPPSIIESIQMRQWRFPVILIQCTEKQYAGENRNTACSQAKGDILILQDADDIPHPQRIAMIKYCFEVYNIEHLMHRYAMVNKETVLPISKTIDPQKLVFRSCTLQARKNSYTNGNIAITKELFAQIQWSNKPRGQDTEFNRKVFEQKTPSLLLPAVLLYYRIFLSSQNKH